MRTHTHRDYQSELEASRKGVAFSTALGRSTLCRTGLSSSLVMILAIHAMEKTNNRSAGPSSWYESSPGLSVWSTGSIYWFVGFLLEGAILAAALCGVNWGFSVSFIVVFLVCIFSVNYPGYHTWGCLPCCFLYFTHKPKNLWYLRPPW